MLESFLGENSFRDGIRRYMAAHKYSNSTTADLWNALSEASGKPVGEIAAAWTEQQGFPVVTVKHDGKTVDAVALATKTGFLYVFDRVTGKPLWPIEERPVPKSEVPRVARILQCGEDWRLILAHLKNDR